MARIFVRLCANSFGLMAILAMTASDFDGTELVAFLAFCVWLGLVEAAAALALVRPQVSERGSAAVDLVPGVGILASAFLVLALRGEPQHHRFDWPEKYMATVKDIP